MSRVGEQAPGSSAISASAAFRASCLDLTPGRPPVMAADQGPVGAASVSGHRGVDAVDAGAWLPPLMRLVETMQQSACPTHVPPRRACTSANMNVRRVLTRPGSLSYNQARTILQTKAICRPRIAWDRRWAGAQLLFRAGTRLATGEPEGRRHRSKGGALPGMSVKPSLAQIRQRPFSATVGPAPTAARSAPTTRTDGTRYRPFSP
jgi:hypothetical protein